MNEAKTTPYTYYVLDNISTFPIVVPLQDYCRKNPKLNEKEIKSEEDKIIKNWKCIEQEEGQDNEKIMIFLNPENKWIGNLN